MGNLRSGREKSFSASAEIFISLLHTNDTNHTVSASPNYLQNTGFFQLLSQLFPVVNLKCNFKLGLCLFISHHKPALVTHYESTVFRHKLVMESHREDRVCRCSYIQLIVLAEQILLIFVQPAPTQRCMLLLHHQYSAEASVSGTLVCCHTVSLPQSLQEVCC